jgi:hypothetical protein
MKAFLEELGFELFPTTEYPVDKYQFLLELTSKDVSRSFN